MANGLGAGLKGIGFNLNVAFEKNKEWNTRHYAGNGKANKCKYGQSILCHNKSRYRGWKHSR